MIAKVERQRYDHDDDAFLSEDGEVEWNGDDRDENVLSKDGEVERQRDDKVNTAGDSEVIIK